MFNPTGRKLIGVEHGKWETWVKGCRCRECVNEARRRSSKGKAKARRGRGLPPNDPRHGTATGYRYHGCRCGPCTAANTEAARESYQRRKQ